MMTRPLSYQINVGGRLFDLSQPRLMQIVNCSPDSFYPQSSPLSPLASMIDVGAYSTRPGHADVSIDEEMHRLRTYFNQQRVIDAHSDARHQVLSVDTFRADVARMCVEEYGVQMVNDVTGGADGDMFKTVARLHVPYVLTCSRAHDITHLSRQVQALRDLGQNDIIIDPGFGFGEGLEDDYYKLSHLEEYHLLELPILVGISRKSMIQRVLDCTADEALNGTTALQMYALMKGVNILRVHDAREADETIKLYNKLCCLDLA